MTRRDPPRIAALLGTVAALVCAPPVAGRLFALDDLVTEDVAWLWVGSATLLALSWGVVDRVRRRRWIVGAFVTLLALIGMELAARTWVNVWAEPWQRTRLSRLGWVTYQDWFAYQGHPFVHYTGRPDRKLVGREEQRGWDRFNQRGFHGPDVPVTRPEGVVRVACLGASTTASGYPRVMQRLLREKSGEDGFECLNFAQGFYTSNHVVANFLLNALEFDPQFVVVHQGWNDGRCAANGAEFRTDYSHVLRAFAYPRVPDALLIRASTLYRFIKVRLGLRDWAYLDAAIFKPGDPALGLDMESAVEVYRRNLATVIDLSLCLGIRPVLVTQPHSTAPVVRFAPTRPHLKRFSGVMREVARARGDDVVFVDLDVELTGRNDLFVDVGHMTDAGIALKAERIGAAILAAWRQR